MTAPKYEVEEGMNESEKLFCPLLKYTKKTNLDLRIISDDKPFFPHFLREIFLFSEL